jgi:hypothetical protein
MKIDKSNEAGYSGRVPPRVSGAHVVLDVPAVRFMLINAQTSAQLARGFEGNGRRPPICTIMSKEYSHQHSPKKRGPRSTTECSHQHSPKERDSPSRKVA